MSVTTERKQELVKKYQINPQDSGSVEVQAAVLTERVKDLSEHFKNHPKDFSSRRGLLMMVGKRSSLLQHLKKTDYKRYKALIDSLGIRK